MAEKYLIGIDGEDVSYEMERSGDAALVRRAGSDRWQRTQLERIGETDLYLLLVDNHPTEIYLERRRGGAHVTIGRHSFDLDVQPWRPGASLRRGPKAGIAGLVQLTAPMTGSVVEVRCRPGDQVAADEVLLVVESMKMNNELRSPAAGRVESVPAAAGQRVKAGDLLVSVLASSDLGEQSARPGG